MAPRPVRGVFFIFPTVIQRDFLPLVRLGVRLSAAVWMTVFFFGCSDTQQGEEFSFERQPQGFRAGVEGEGDSIKWVLKWEPPADLELLLNYHLWAVLTDETGEVADFISRQTGFSSDLNVSTLPAGIRLWSLPADLSVTDEWSWEIPAVVHTEADRLKLSTVRWLLWAEYSRGTPGSRLSTRTYYRDVFPPEPVVAAVEPFADSARIIWKRPFDLSDHLNPSQSGLIYGYRLLFISRNGPFPGSVTFSPLKTVKNGDLYPHQSISPIEGKALTPSHHTDWPPRSDTVSLVVTDGNRYFPDAPDGNQIGIVVRGLSPLKEYTVRITPYDSLGVLRDLDDHLAEIRPVEFKTTDRTPPVLSGPLSLQATSLPGAYQISFEAATDVETTIARYIFERIDRDTSEGFADTLQWIVENEEMIKKGKMVSSLIDFIVPGLLVQLKVYAVDGSGHKSLPIDTVFSLQSAVALQCPSGMVPVAGGELPDFCMERFEHRQDGKFITEIRWEQAREACIALSDLSWTTDLCTEQEWVQACHEGTSRQWGVLTYDEETLPQFLLQECYLGTGDSTASSSVLNRSLRCTTGEGVRDLPGHFQEWVRGPETDSLRIKGGSWLKGNGIDQTTQQSLAACQAHSKGMWSRPRFALRGVHDTLFVLGDSVRYTLDRRDSLLMLRVTDTLLWQPGDSVQSYQIFAAPSGTQVLGVDTLRHYPHRSGWVDAHANGLDYRPVGAPLPAFFWGERTLYPGMLYQHRTVGFRCCALPRK